MLRSNWGCQTQRANAREGSRPKREINGARRIVPATSRLILIWVKAQAHPLLDTSSLAILARACSMLRSARTISSGRRRRWPKENSHRCRFRRTITTTYARGSDWRQRWSTACERTIFFTTAIPTESISSFIALSLAKGFSWRSFSEAAAILATAHRTQFSALPLSGVCLGQTFRHESL